MVNLLFYDRFDGGRGFDREEPPHSRIHTYRAALPIIHAAAKTTATADMGDKQNGPSVQQALKNGRPNGHQNRLHTYSLKGGLNGCEGPGGALDRRSVIKFHYYAFMHYRIGEGYKPAAATLP